MSVLLPTKLRTAANGMRRIHADVAREAADEIERLREAAKLAAKIIDTNLYHQREKVVDASSILKDALNR